MKLNVGLKLGFWLALFGILSTALIGYYMYSSSRDLLTKSAEGKLLTATQVLARRISYSLEQTVNDLEFVATLPSVVKLADRTLTPAERHAEQVKIEDVFFSLLASHLDYFQVRLIGADHNGRELIRVDRDESGLQRVRGRDLQEKGHFAYVYEALRMAAGEFYFSEINLNREQGAHQGLNKPTLRIATAARAANGDVFGVIVFNVDLDGMFDRMRTDIPDDIEVLLTNQQGDYLIHPDVEKTFGFDQGRRIRVQDDIPATDALLTQRKSDLVLTVADAENDSDSAAAFVRVPFGDPAKQRFLMVGLMTPLEKVLQDSRTLGLNILRIALALGFLALVMSFVLSRVLTHPLDAMARAVECFEAGRPITGLPVERNDEIGYLAKSFLSMTSKLNLQVGDLQTRQLRLDYLAHHDALTGLPNRILFLDRLIQAIHKAHRGRKQFAVMFIDLDKFKDVNDSLGHHVGDEVLKLAAGRMQSIIRQEDTLSRLGGDEFTIIVEDLQQADQCSVIAEKLVALFELPFTVGGDTIDLTCSIGVSIYPCHGLQAEQLLHHADAAMYQAKKMGRNNYQVYDDEAAPA